MPSYEYRCSACGQVVAANHRMADGPYRDVLPFDVVTDPHDAICPAKAADLADGLDDAAVEALFAGWVATLKNPESRPQFVHLLHGPVDRLICAVGMSWGCPRPDWVDRNGVVVNQPDYALKAKAKEVERLTGGRVNAARALAQYKAQRRDKTLNPAVKTVGVSGLKSG